MESSSLTFETMKSNSTKIVETHRINNNTFRINRNRGNINTRTSNASCEVSTTFPEPPQQVTQEPSKDNNDNDWLARMEAQ